MTPRFEADFAVIRKALRAAKTGAASADIAKAAGMDAERARTVLKTARGAGMVRMARMGMGMLWCLSSQAKAMADRIERDKRDRAENRYRRRYSDLIVSADAIKRGQREAIGAHPQSLMRVVAAARGGKTAKALAAGLGMSLNSAKKLLFFAGRAGLLVKHQQGDSVLWQHPDDPPPKQRERQPTTSADEADTTPIVRRLGVDPRAPLPFVCRAAASVFHLGGGL